MDIIQNPQSIDNTRFLISANNTNDSFCLIWSEIRQITSDKYPNRVHMGKPSKEQFDIVPELLANEEWRDISGYEGLYKVSNNGNIMRMETYITEVTAYGELVSQRVTPPYILKSSTSVNGGYLVCGLTKGKTTAQFRVHRLVAEAFCARESIEQTEVHHIDGDRENAKATNLLWVTPLQHQMLHNEKPRTYKYPAYRSKQ